MGILVIAVDLGCGRCRAKITKVLDCLKEEFCIEKVELEDKSNKVVVRGKYDAEKLCKKVWCKARKVVKEIVIVEVWPIPPPPKPCKPSCTPEHGHCKPPEKPKPADPCKKPADLCCTYCKQPDHCHCCKQPDPCKTKKAEEPKKPAEEPKKKPAPPKTEYKLVPYPYPVPYGGAVCPSWPWPCPPQQPCHHCCQKQAPAPAPTPPPPSARPCQCGWGGQPPCSCDGRPPVWAPAPVYPPPWPGCTVIADDNQQCSIM